MVDDTIANGGDSVEGAASHGASGKRPTGAPTGVTSVQGALALALVAASANDNATTVSEPAIYTLAGGDALVTWVGPDSHAHGHLCAPAETDEAGYRLAPPEYAAINASLGDLGPVVPTLEAARRIVVVEPRPGTFAIMWLALAESSPAIRGKIFVAAGEGGLNGDGESPWKEHAIPEAALPGFAGGLRVAVDVAEQLVVTYATAQGSHSIFLSGRYGDESLGVGEYVQPAAEEGLAHAANIGPAVDLAALLIPAAAVQASVSATEPHTSQQQPVSGIATTPSAFEVAAEVGTSETAPIVTAIDDRFVVAWQIPGGWQGVSQIKLTLFDKQGVAQPLADGSTVLLVSDNVAADVAPAVSRYGDGVAVAYKRGGEQGDLAVKVYGATGAQIGQETVVDAGETGKIIEIASASIHGNHEEGDNHPQLALVYTVEDPDADFAGSYGNIMLQRLGVFTDAGSAQIVLLGRDGERDGDERPALMIEHNGASEPVVGRAPTVAGLDNGEFAVVWVEQDGARETIRGGVLEMDGEQVLHIDLTGLIEDSGIVKGTRPTLLDAGDGNILVSWLQRDGDDGDYVVMAAHYHSAGYGLWVEPDQPIRLKAFDAEPDDYSVILSHANGVGIIVTWEQDGSGRSGGDQIFSQRFDIAGNSLGDPVPVANGFALAKGQQASTDSLAAAGLADGKIVVVYAEQSSNGDTDLAAHIVDVGKLDDKASSTSGSHETVQLGDGVDDAEFSTQIDEEIAINILGSSGVSVARVNGAPIDAATAIDIGSAWVQLREDGWLTVSPDAGYSGTISFECTVASPAGSEMTSSVRVNVENTVGPLTEPFFNQITALAEDLPKNYDDKSAGISQDQGLGKEGLSIAGLDGDMFTIIGSTLYLKAGIEFDFETKPWSMDEPRATSGRDAVAHHASDNDGGIDFASFDTLVFSAYGLGRDNDNDEVELPSSGYATFQQLAQAGALAQVGDDVVITLSDDGPANPNTITLRSVALSDLMDPAFKL